MTKKLDYLKDYPLYEKNPELIKTQTGRSVDEINMENILSGKVTDADCRISSQTLIYQAEIQESFGNPQVGANFRRAAEMTRIEDDRILQIYNCMRPHVSTKQELLDIAEELDTKYNAKDNAELVRKAVEVYEDRKMFRKD